MCMELCGLGLGSEFLTLIGIDLPSLIEFKLDPSLSFFGSNLHSCTTTLTSPRGPVVSNQKEILKRDKKSFKSRFDDHKNKNKKRKRKPGWGKTG